MQKVILEHAFTYICPTCGERNFVLSEAANQEDPEDLLKAMQAFGYMEEWQGVDDLPKDVGGFLITSPETVTCELCSHVFESLDGEDDTIQE